jgi:hypothetical protein
MIFLYFVRRAWYFIPKEREHSEDLRVDGRITLKWTLEKYGMDCIRMAQYTDCGGLL